MRKSTIITIISYLISAFSFGIAVYNLIYLDMTVEVPPKHKINWQRLAPSYNAENRIMEKCLELASDPEASEGFRTFVAALKTFPGSERQSKAGYSSSLALLPSQPRDHLVEFDYGDQISKNKSIEERKEAVAAVVREIVLFGVSILSPLYGRGGFPKSWIDSVGREVRSLLQAAIAKCKRSQPPTHLWMVLHRGLRSLQSQHGWNVEQLRELVSRIKRGRNTIA